MSNLGEGKYSLSRSLCLFQHVSAIMFTRSQGTQSILYFSATRPNGGKKWNDTVQTINMQVLVSIWDVDLQFPLRFRIPVRLAHMVTTNFNSIIVLAANCQNCSRKSGQPT